MLSDTIWITIQSQDQDFMALCLLSLYDRQESHEQASRSTREDNGMGFNTSDAAFLTQMAEKLKLGQDLPSSIWVIISKALKKYCRQLSTVEKVAQYFE